MVRNYILLTLFWSSSILLLAQLLSHFCLIITSPNKIRQRVEQPKVKSIKPSP